MVQVRFAKSHQFVQAGTGPEDNRQLFFSNAPATSSEEDLSTLFSAFGTVEEINLFRERKTGNSKGSGFVTMGSREQAMRALESLEDTTGEVRVGLRYAAACSCFDWKSSTGAAQARGRARLLLSAHRRAACIKLCAFSSNAS
jgi:hypothetical protein